MKNVLLAFVMLLLFSTAPVMASGVSQKDLAGTWSGTFTDDGGNTGSVTLVVTESANSARVSQFSGSISITTGACGTISHNLRGMILGDSALQILADFTGFTSFNFWGEESAGGASISGFYFAGGCGLRTGTISLTR